MNKVRQKGYTILETMIVLAVSASMFLFVATTFGGRQEQVQFTQAVRDLDSKLNDIINDVSTGYYPKNEDKVCELSNGSNARPEFNLDTSGTPLELGANNDCVNIGKIIQFSPLGVNRGNNDNEQFLNVYNVAGLRKDDTNVSPITIEDSIPTADPDPQTILLKWGLRVTKIIDDDPSPRPYGAISVFSSLNRSSRLETSDSNEDVRIYPLPGTLLDMSEADLVLQVNDISGKISRGEVDINTRQEIRICVSNENEDKRAFITIGGANSSSVIEFDEVEVCNP